MPVEPDAFTVAFGAAVRNNGIDPKDAVHLATALSLGLGFFDTFDGPLISQSGALGSPPLIIGRPVAPPPPTTQPPAADVEQATLGLAEDVLELNEDEPEG